MSPSSNCTRIIKWYEASDLTGTRPKLKAYTCPAGKPTIGWGTTRYPDGSLVQIGESCTLAQAEQFLLADLNEACKTVNRLFRDLLRHSFNGQALFKGLLQQEYDGLVSCCHNIGSGHFEDSSLVSYLRHGFYDPASVGAYYGLWKKGGGKVLAGLVSRRRSEGELHTTGQVHLYDSDGRLLS